jgi:holo-[acyl-carrier protein] synthase
MILGTGVDLIEIDRIDEAVKSERFNHRIFTELELAESKAASHHLAGYFAAKEALLKAMGTGLSCFSWQEIEIRHDAQGAPYFKVNNKVHTYLSELGVGRVHLSISHCKEYAIAQVILEGGEPK